MVVRTDRVAQSMAGYLAHRLRDISFVREIWMTTYDDRLVFWIVTMPFDPRLDEPLYEAVAATFLAYPQRYAEFHVLNPSEFETDDPDTLFSLTIPRGSVLVEVDEAA